MPGEELLMGAMKQMGAQSTGMMVGGAEFAYGLIKSKKAKKEAEELQKNRPKYQLQPFTYNKNDIALAESLSVSMS